MGDSNGLLFAIQVILAPLSILTKKIFIVVWGWVFELKWSFRVIFPFLKWPCVALSSWLATCYKHTFRPHSSITEWFNIQPSLDLFTHIKIGAIVIVSPRVYTRTSFHVSCPCMGHQKTEVYSFMLVSPSSDHFWRAYMRTMFQVPAKTTIQFLVMVMFRWIRVGFVIFFMNR